MADSFVLNYDDSGNYTLNNAVIEGSKTSLA